MLTYRKAMCTDHIITKVPTIIRSNFHKHKFYEEHYLLIHGHLAFFSEFPLFCLTGLCARKTYPSIPQGCSLLNILGPEQSGHYFANELFKCIFLNKTSLKLVTRSSINNKSSLIQIIAWYRIGVKPIWTWMNVNAVLRCHRALLSYNELNTKIVSPKYRAKCTLLLNGK